MIIASDKKTMNIVKWITPFTGMWTVYGILMWLLTKTPMVVYNHKSLIIITAAVLCVSFYKYLAPTKKVWFLYATILVQWFFSVFWFAFSGYLTASMPVLPVLLGLILPAFLCYTIVCGLIVLTFVAKKRAWRILGCILIIIWLILHKSSAYVLDVDISRINTPYLLINYITLLYGWCLLFSYFVIERRSGKIVMGSEKNTNIESEEQSYSQGDNVLVMINEQEVRANIRTVTSEYIVLGFDDESFFDDNGKEIFVMSVTPDEFNQILRTER